MKNDILESQIEVAATIKLELNTAGNRMKSRKDERQYCQMRNNSHKSIEALHVKLEKLDNLEQETWNHTVSDEKTFQ